MVVFKLRCLTVCVTCGWAGVDSVWEQKKPEATLREMLEKPNAVPSGGSPQRPVHIILVLVQDALLGAIVVCTVITENRKSLFVHIDC